MQGSVRDSHRRLWAHPMRSTAGKAKERFLGTKGLPTKPSSRIRSSAFSAVAARPDWPPAPSRVISSFCDEVSKPLSNLHNAAHAHGMQSCLAGGVAAVYSSKHFASRSAKDGSRMQPRQHGQVRCPVLPETTSLPEHAL